MKTTNKNNAQAQATKPPSIYVGMYREIKAAAQTPSAVVKSFYNAALSINGGEKRAEALEAMEGLGETAKGAKK